MADPPRGPGHQGETFINETNHKVGRKYLIGGHRKRVNITLLRRVAVREAKLLWIQKFWSHVTDDSRIGSRHVDSLHNSGIGDNRCDSKVPNTCVTLLSDQDISLNGLKISTGLHSWLLSLTGVILLCTILSE